MTEWKYWLYSGRNYKLNYLTYLLKKFLNDRMRGEEVDLFTKRSKLKSNVAQTTRTNNQSYVKCQGTPSRRMWSFLFMVEK